MTAFRNYSIRKKLMAMSLLASGGVLLLASAAFMTYDFFAYRSSLVSSLSTLGKIISSNTTAAVLFNDTASAEKTLTSLKARPSIQSVGIYTPTGQVFASWHRDAAHPTSLPPLPMNGKESHQFDRSSLSVFYPMVLDNSVIGTVYMKSDLTELITQLQRYAVIGMGVLILCFFVAGLIS